MTSEFDKEIDVLLRQAAQSETASAAANPTSRIQHPTSAHLDADEVSAFAENSLPNKTKQKYTIHLANCSRCRSILANLIALDAETETPVIQVEKTEKTAPVIPWYRKFFASPNMAFTMGALLLAFTGLIAFVVLQNNNRTSGLEISQISEQTEKAQGPSLNEILPAQESFSNSTMSNSMSSNSMAMSNAAPSISSTNSALTQSETKMTSIPAANSNMSAAPKPTVSASEPSRPEIREDNFAMLPNKNKLQPEAANTNTTADKAKENRKANDEKEEIKVLENSDAAKSAPNQTLTQLPVNGRSVPKESLSATANRKIQEKSETTSVGGKNFKRANGIWTDSAYKGQSITKISRGTNEYKKLDSNLRSIVENLGGTVIIVWKDKTYRIQ